MFINHSQEKKQGGYIALVAILLVLSGVVTLGVAMSMNGLNEAQLGYFERQSINAFYLADACANEAILRLKEDAVSGYTQYTGGEIHPSGMEDEFCSITMITSGTKRTIQIEGHNKQIIRRLLIIIEVQPNFSVRTWKEVSSFK